MARVILVLVSIALTIYALADCISTDESRCKGLPKLVWVLLIVFVPWIGPIVWLLIGKDRSDGTPTGLNAEFQEYFSPSKRAQRRNKKFQNRPLAPDEDPEFLAQLDKQIREERRAKYQKSPESTDSELTDSSNDTNKEKPDPANPENEAPDPDKNSDSNS